MQLGRRGLTPSRLNVAQEFAQIPTQLLCKAQQWEWRSRRLAAPLCLHLGRGRRHCGPLGHKDKQTEFGKAVVIEETRGKKAEKLKIARG